MPVIRTKNKGVWDRTTTRTPIDDTLTKKGYAADAAAVGEALKNGTGGTSDAVQYIPQTLTEEQQMQARRNLGLYNRGQTLLDEAGLALENGTGQVGLADLAYGDIRVVLTSDLRSTEFYGTAFYIGNPVYAWNFEVKTADGRHGLRYDGYAWEYLSLGGQEGTVMDGTYTVQVYSLDTEQVPEEYIPDTIARKTDIPQSGNGEETDPTVQGWAKADIPAAVGQYFRVSEVDENGNVLAVEAVDAPSGGGKVWRLIAVVTTTEDLKEIIISEDTDGNPFSLCRVAVKAAMQGANSASANVFFDAGGVSTGKSRAFSGTTKQDYQAYAEVVGGSGFIMETTPIVNTVAAANMYTPENTNGTVDAIAYVKFSTYQSILAGAKFTIWGVDA